MPELRPEAQIGPGKLKAASKGFLANYYDPNDRLVFQYNPPMIDEEKSVGWTEITIPGSDDNLYQFGGGNNLTLTVSLFFNQLGEAVDTNYVEDSIKWLHSFTETRRGVPMQGLAPGLLLFGFGSSVFGAGSGYGYSSTPALLVHIESMRASRMFFEKTTLITRRAQVELNLVRHLLYPR